SKAANKRVNNPLSNQNNSLTSKLRNSPENAEDAVDMPCGQQIIGCAEERSFRILLTPLIYDPCRRSASILNDALRKLSTSYHCSNPVRI
ncbi:MAG: hypothetical protein ABFR19_02115, partial [Pseudomonadota bacterium]